MTRLLTASILILVLFAGCRQKNIEKQNAIDKNWKEVPKSWINNALSPKYKTSDTSLLYQFANLIKPDTIDSPPKDFKVNGSQFVFSSLAVDLDSDGENELICLQGWNVYAPFLCIFKQRAGKWYMIYKEEINTFYDTPTVYLANNASVNKTFYLRRVYNHGSGVFLDGYTFYKLIDNKVYKCLDIINEARIFGWGLYINQEVSSKIDFNSNGTDMILVDYSYNFFPGAVDNADCAWCADPNLSLIKGNDKIWYRFNPKNKVFEYDASWNEKSTENLNPDKIACFGNFGNDSLFIKAFKPNIDAAIKNGTGEQKRLLKQYLKLAAKNKTTSNLELKSEAGGTKFYGPTKM